MPCHRVVVSADLGKRIKHARELAGMTQEELAQQVGVVLRTVGNWERGATVPQRKLAKVGAVLGVNLAVGGDGDDPGYVSAPGERVEGSVIEQQLLDEIRQMRREVDERLSSVERRLDELQ